MDGKRWQKIKLVLGAVLDQKPAAREKFLERVCAHDPLLRHEVRALLEQEDDAFLDRPLVDPRHKRLVDSPPERVRSYRIAENIGAGGMGFVYRVVDDTGTSFALKRVPAAQVSEQTLKRFRREAKTAARLRHANIVRILSSGEQGGDPFILMEYLKGETIGELLRRKERITVELTIDVATQVARGLEFAHARGVVHRDLKPSNLFRTDDGIIKILDFGIAKPLAHEDDGARSGVSKLTKTGEVLGSPNYMAPEQARAESVDPHADLFSLGSILYEMLTGKLAVSGDSLAARINSLLVDEPTPIADYRPDVPPRLGELIHRCLAKTAAERPESASELLERLRIADT